MKKYLTAIVVLLTFANCTSEKADTPSTNPTTKTHFPPVTGTAWEIKTIESLGWKPTAVQPLLDYLTQKTARSTRSGARLQRVPTLLKKDKS